MAPGLFGHRIVLSYKDSDLRIQFYPHDPFDVDAILAQAQTIIKEYDEGRL